MVPVYIVSFVLGTTVVYLALKTRSHTPWISTWSLLRLRTADRRLAVGTVPLSIIGCVSSPRRSDSTLTRRRRDVDFFYQQQGSVRAPLNIVTNVAEAAQLRRHVLEFGWRLLRRAALPLARMYQRRSRHSTSRHAALRHWCRRPRLARLCLDLLGSFPSSLRCEKDSAAHSSQPKETSRGYPTGNRINLTAACLITFITILLLLYIKRENRQRAAGKRDWRLDASEEDVEQLGWRHPAYRLSI